jgi:hypothetical protein
MRWKWKLESLLVVAHLLKETIDQRSPAEIAGIGGEPQLQKKRGRLTTLRVSNAAENTEPQPNNKRG